MVESEPRTVQVSCAECGTRAEMRQMEAGSLLYVTEVASTCKHGLQGDERPIVSAAETGELGVVGRAQTQQVIQ
jgi:hypothetical protein